MANLTFSFYHVLCVVCAAIDFTVVVVVVVVAVVVVMVMVVVVVVVVERNVVNQHIRHLGKHKNTSLVGVIDLKQRNTKFHSIQSTPIVILGGFSGDATLLPQ